MGTATTRRASRTLRWKPSRNKMGYRSLASSRSCHVVNNVFSRLTTRETALFDRCAAPNNGWSAVRMRRLFTPAR